ncbi:MAG: tagaturonate epimerase family protein [Anaerolineae bacterium]
MERLAPDLRSSLLDITPSSVVCEDGLQYGLARIMAQPRLAVLAPTATILPPGFSGEYSELEGKLLLLCQLNSRNAQALRQRLSWLRPRLLGRQTSAGMGDRLGLATPGHIHALRAVKGNIAPIFAQQSMREMARTRRSPQEVMDDATWAMFAEGWTHGAGADADHLKTCDDIEQCLTAGFTFFTFDPGAHVDGRARNADAAVLRELAAALPEEITPRASGLQDKTFALRDSTIHFDERTLLRAAVKYGRAVAHVAGLFRYLESAAGAKPFEVEISVDETDQPTSHAEHIYIASELKRLGVAWVSLAPRFVGRFEKGVDYIGDVAEFEADIAQHAEIARRFGPYKLSLHSGSDKFSIYPAAMQQTRGLVHLKTAGTSYLEALRTIAVYDPAMLREIYRFARERYETDRATYHVSAQLAMAPEPGMVTDWVALLDQFDAREILHVTFGSVLTENGPDGRPRFHNRLMDVLLSYPDAYAANLERHFVRHLRPFAAREA